ncbi:MAG: hypothetical protein MI867_06355 [Pseudomonadales bacterium]|nr:hypothetical protein [Pseudomonadales bacterium]
MKNNLGKIAMIGLLVVAGAGCAATPGTQAKSETVVWNPGVDVEAFWQDYAKTKGGLTWGKSSSYPEYEKVKEGDTLLIQLEQGPCLMEFFHSRWRRANDVRRWDPSINEYGGCPYVFE